MCNCCVSKADFLKVLKSRIMCFYNTLNQKYTFTFIDYVKQKKIVKVKSLQLEMQKMAGNSKLYVSIIHSIKNTPCVHRLCKN